MMPQNATFYQLKSVTDTRQKAVSLKYLCCVESAVLMAPVNKDIIFQKKHKCLQISFIHKKNALYSMVNKMLIQENILKIII